MRWDKDTSIGKAKQGIHSHCPWAGRCSATPGQQGSSCGTVTWEDEWHHSKHPPLLPSPALCAEHGMRYSGISLGSAEVIWLGCVHSLVHSQPMAGGVGSRSSFGSVSSLLSSGKNFPVLSEIPCVCSTNPTHSTILPTMEKLTLFQPKPAN